jgi:hypothetical protein
MGCVDSEMPRPSMGSCGQGLEGSKGGFSMGCTDWILRGRILRGERIVCA